MLQNTSPDLISPLQATILLKQRCLGFLASLVAPPVEGHNIEDTSIIRKFEDVFSKNLLDLPSDREIDFSIELLLGAASISKAPYCMALVKLEELKEQL